MLKGITRRHNSKDRQYNVQKKNNTTNSSEEKTLTIEQIILYNVLPNNNPGLVFYLKNPGPLCP
jgi:hypothetical protein